MNTERQKLNSEKQRLERQADAIFATADAAGQRDLTAAELKSLDTITARKAEIDVRLRQLDAERDAAGRAWSEGNPEASGGRGVFSGPRYSQMFPAAASASNGWDNFGEFMSAVFTRNGDPRLMAALDGGNVSIPSEGGFTVPTAFYAGLLDASLEDEIVRPRARIIPMNTEKVEAPIWDSYDRSGGSVFGFTARWMAESASGTKQKPSLAAIALQLKKLGIFVPATNRLLRHGVGLEEQLAAAMRLAIGWTLDLAFLTGTGAGQPLGVLNSPNLVVVAKETGQAAATVVYANLASMAARHVNYSRAVWVCSQTVMPHLLELSIPVGTGGSHVPVLTGEGNDLSILKRPVIFTEKLPALGSQGDVLLADFDRYAIGMGRDAEIERSEHALFEDDQTYFRILSDVDGMAIDVDDETPRNGSTLSPFVTLAERA